MKYKNIIQNARLRLYRGLYKTVDHKHTKQLLNKYKKFVYGRM